jgi:AcrR family transcriptional regulator
MTDSRPYHHGNLRREILDAALAAIEEDGPEALSMRALARRAGVSHAAPAYHFGDKAGLLTAIATEGYRLLTAELRAAHAAGGFLDIGLAYIDFAITNRAHFAVMYRPDVYGADDPELVAARSQSSELLYGPAGEQFPDRDNRRVGIAGWSFAHGFATLWLSGNLGDGDRDDARAAARAAGSVLFGSR